MSNLKNGFAPCHLSWKYLLHPYPLAKKFFLHPATSIDNASCTPTPWQKNTILSQFIQFQHYGEKDTLAYREMKLLLPGGRGAGGIISWGGRVQKHFFCQGVGVQEAFSAEVAGCKTIFQIWHFFLKFNLKILSIWFS